MKVFSLLLIALSLLVSSCSSVQHRDPASVGKEKEDSHQKFQGLFDRQY